MYEIELDDLGRMLFDAVGYVVSVRGRRHLGRDGRWRLRVEHYTMHGEEGDRESWEHDRQEERLPWLEDKENA